MRDDRSPLPVVAAETSSFDAIRRVDQQGEYWDGRDLQPMLGYDKWERMVDAIERARISLNNAGDDADIHASRLREPSGRTERVNYRLTRHGAYIVAMSADVRKPEVALAQAYFARKTREAETGAVVAIPAPRELSRLELIDIAREAELGRLAEKQGREVAERQRDELKPAASAWTELASAEGDYSVAAAAKILSRDPAIRATHGVIGQNQLFKLLAKERWLFRRGKHWEAYQDQVGLDRLAERVRTFYDKDGVQHTAAAQVRITAKGIEALHKRWGGSEPLALTGGPDEVPAQLELPSGGAA